jgi:uncharacterized membrane protein YkgB
VAQGDAEPCLAAGGGGDQFRKERDMNSLGTKTVRARPWRVQEVIRGWLARHSIVLLRISLGLVFLGFGVLKFFPGVSPAEDLAERTMHELTLGQVPGSAGIVAVAALETAIGLSLTTGRYQRVGLALLGGAMVGVLSPLALFYGDLFSRPYKPTLEGQYVLKDVVLLAAGFVVAVGGRGGRIVTGRDRSGDGAARGTGDDGDRRRPRAGLDSPPPGGSAGGRTGRPAGAGRPTTRVRSGSGAPVR